MSALEHEINQKAGYKPYYARCNTIMQFPTDMDHFPYSRFYRGDYRSTEPVVYDRTVGYRLREDPCYTPINQTWNPIQPDNCFQTGCNTVYPCYPSYLRKYSDKEAMELMLNRRCVNSWSQT